MLVLVGVASLLAVVPAVPHHSFAAVFDVNRPIEFAGTVTRIEWTNPHAWIPVDTVNADGNVENWSVELLGINTLLKQGWRPDILKPGDVISVEGFGSRDGGTSANATAVTVADTGEQLWVSASREDSQEEF